MTTYDKTLRAVFSISRQMASIDVRRKALATLRPGDPVQAMERETGEVVAHRLLTGISLLYTAGWTKDIWPVRYWCSDDGLPDWEADEDGRQVHDCTEYMDGGWILCRSWLSAEEVVARMSADAARTRKPSFSWPLWKANLATVQAAILTGASIPEEPWQKD